MAVKTHFLFHFHFLFLGSYLISHFFRYLVVKDELWIVVWNWLSNRSSAPHCTTSLSDIFWEVKIRHGRKLNSHCSNDWHVIIAFWDPYRVLNTPLTSTYIDLRKQEALIFEAKVLVWFQFILIKKHKNTELKF